MLIKFSLTNYKTFRERAEWSMVATDDTTFEDDNVAAVPGFDLRLLKSAVVYGANASGKTKLVEAMGLLKSLVREFLTFTPDEAIPVGPFLLNTTSADEPSEFEIIFLFLGTRYRYGFEADTSHIVAEWLFAKVFNQEDETEIFYRDGQVFTLSENSGPQLHKLQADEVVRENELLLPKAAQYNSPDAREVWHWFRNFNAVTALTIDRYQPIMLKQLKNPAQARILLELVQAADLNIETAQPSGFDGEDVMTQHIRYDAENQAAEKIWFRLSEDESAGTQQFFVLMALVADTLASGSVLVVDELDAALHPNLVLKIVRLFNSSFSNPNRAQLLFNTHDTNLLASDSPFRRDQIWFTEKDKYGAAKLYSLADFEPDTPSQPGQPVRFTHLERDYLNGRYGAVPFLGRFGNADVVVDKSPTNHGQ